MARRPKSTAEQPEDHDGDIPPYPPEDLRYGDKTPEVVAWYREHHPDEFARRYANRKIGPA